LRLRIGCAESFYSAEVQEPLICVLRELVVCDHIGLDLLLAWAAHLSPLANTDGLCIRLRPERNARSHKAVTTRGDI